MGTVPVRGAPASYVLGFGRDPAGRLYLLSSERGSVGGTSGAVHRLEAP